MRPFLIVLVGLTLFALAWHAAFNGTQWDRFRGAPQLAAEIRTAVAALADSVSGDPIEVEVDGRTVTLEGAVADATERSRIAREIAAVPLVVRVDDRLTLLPRAEPYTLSITKSESTLRIEGHVPSRRAGESLAEAAQGAAGEGKVETDLRVAAGVPEGDWLAMVTRGISALAGLDAGSLAISGTSVRLHGIAPDGATERRVAESLDGAGMGEWEIDLRASRPDDGIAFRAVLPETGEASVEGLAPDRAIARALPALLAEETGQAVTGRLRVADGPSDDAWSDRATAAISALARLREGELAVRGEAVTLSGTVETDEDMAALRPLLRPDWETLVVVLNPTPPGDVRIVQSGDGRLTVNGRLPEGVMPEMLAAALPGLDTTGLSARDPGRPADWAPALDGLSIVLPRFERAEVRLLDRSLEIAGRLHRGYSAVGVEAALTAALGRDWTIRVDAEELRPLPGLTIAPADRGLLVSGVVPHGLEPDTVLDLLGPGAVREGLTGGGDGDPETWKALLGAVGAARTGFARFAAEIADGDITLSGRLLPGYPPEEVSGWIADRLPGEWSVKVTANGERANEGDMRVPLGTDVREQFRNGFWLPDLRFPVSPESCAAQTEAALGEDRLDFAEDADKLADPDARLLDRLAAVAIRCLNSSTLRLEVAAYTDSVGNDARNRELSQRRAGAVARQLARRGVRADGLLPVGRGEDDPVASNNTEEGRALNDRIAFRWLAPDQ